jgi:hypothetical protein
LNLPVRRWQAAGMAPLSRTEYEAYALECRRWRIEMFGEWAADDDAWAMATEVPCRQRDDAYCEAAES